MSNNMLLLIALAGCGFLYYQMTKKDKRKDLLDYAASMPPKDAADFTSKINAMSEDEIADTHSLIFDYMQNGQKVTDPLLQYRLSVISQKYNLFT